MGSEINQSPRLPVINFSPLNPETPKWESVRSQVLQALEEFGCFEALLEEIPRDIFDAAQEFFDLPVETKQLNVSNKPVFGYNSYGHTQEARPHEAIVIDNANIAQKVQSFTNVSWPQGNPSFCKTIHSYSEKLSELIQIIMRMIFKSYGIEKNLEEHLESIDFALRLIKYEKPEISETKYLAFRNHTDKGVLGILNQNQVDGLEVQTKDGQWISVKRPSPGSFVVVVGEVLSSILTNGRLHCPLHRVMMTGNKTRYSASLFSIPKKDYLIKTPEELVDEEHPLMFKPFYFYDFIRFFVTEGKKTQSGLACYRL